MQEMTITSTQCRMARAALRWTIDELVEASGVGRATVARFETDAEIKPSTAAKLRAAFEAQRIRFVDDGPFAGAVSSPS